MTSYSSFLLVRHATHCDLYIKGNQIGTWKDGRFVRAHTVDTADGSKKPVEMDVAFLKEVAEIASAAATSTIKFE